MNAKWLFKDGATTVECTSFPYAFRTMWNTIKKGVESGKRTHADMIKSMSIVSPHKDRMGEIKRYSFAEAQSMAETMGLLNAAGEINSREFRR